MAAEYWGKGNILVILTAFTGIYAVYITGTLGASRIIFALARHRLLPHALAQLDGANRIPRKALHAVFILVLVGDVAAELILRNGLAAFTWWANAMVFFATLTFAAVNVANLFYFVRIAPSRFSWFSNLVVPVIGVISTVYVMYQAFFVALWNMDFLAGRSVVYFGGLLFLLFIVVVLLMQWRSPERLRGAAPIEANADATTAEITGTDRQEPLYAAK
jgi:amino acid transporter